MLQSQAEWQGIEGQPQCSAPCNSYLQMCNKHDSVACALDWGEARHAQRQRLNC